MGMVSLMQDGAPAMAQQSSCLRILAVSITRFGGNDDSLVRAFRRAGHSVLVVTPENYFPRWEQLPMKAIRRLLWPALGMEFNKALADAASRFMPHLLFVFKGQHVSLETLKRIKAQGAIAINFYPDTGFDDRGSQLRQTISSFDWFFTTKPVHVQHIAETYGCETASFVPHAFDPDMHRPVALDRDDRERYGCDVSFIGNMSPKKRKTLEHLRAALPDIDLRIWGGSGWSSTRERLGPVYQGTEVWGAEYAKAIRASEINLGLLFEGTSGAPAGDHITARTFEIPAAGGFMLHERTGAAMEHFEEGKECAFFSDPDDLVAKIRYYLSHAEERQAIAAAGRQRCLTSGYSVDDRVATVIARYNELRGARDKAAQVASWRQA